MTSRRFLFVAALAFLGTSGLGTPGAVANDEPRAERAEDGGFWVKGADDIVNSVQPRGLAAADHDAIVRAAFGETVADEFSAGRPLPGDFEITVARPDGSLLRYPNATAVVVFARGDTMQQRGRVITLDGAVMFTPSSEEETAGAASRRRLDDGMVTLTRRVPDDL